MLTLPGICEQFSVSRETVLSWISAGELAAIDVSPHGSKRRQWRVSTEALSRFFRRQDCENRAKKFFPNKFAPNP